jgi:hypothetical protein
MGGGLKAVSGGGLVIKLVLLLSIDHQLASLERFSAAVFAATERAREKPPANESPLWTYL